MNASARRSLYRGVLASDPDNSRALYRLAQLAPRGSPEAVALLRRYVKLEPGDPWGNMALGDALAKAGWTDEAIEQYAIARRKAPAESDVYTGLGRILRDAGRADEPVANYEQWVSRQPKNAEAWLESGARGSARSATPRPPVPTPNPCPSKRMSAPGRCSRARWRNRALSLAALFGLAHDSDENRITRWDLEAEWQLTERSRVGLHAERIEVKDPSARARSMRWRSTRSGSRSARSSSMAWRAARASRRAKPARIALCWDCVCGGTGRRRAPP